MLKPHTGLIVVFNADLASAGLDALAASLDDQLVVAAVGRRGHYALSVTLTDEPLPFARQRLNPANHSPADNRNSWAMFVSLMDTASAFPPYSSFLQHSLSSNALAAHQQR